MLTSMQQATDRLRELCTSLLQVINPLFISEQWFNIDTGINIYFLSYSSQLRKCSAGQSAAPSFEIGKYFTEYSWQDRKNSSSTHDYVIKFFGDAIACKLCLIVYFLCIFGLKKLSYLIHLWDGFKVKLFML